MAALQPLKFLTVAPRTKHTATVIFVHGLGDSGHGWKPVADMLSVDPALAHVKWVLPHAYGNHFAVTANMGMKMPSWFDIESFDFETAVEDEAGMLKTVHQLNGLITAEVDAGIEAKRVVLGGFSQGAAMSVLTGLTTERKLGGVVALSGWLPLRTKFKSMVSEHARSLPIFWGHGVADPVVPFPLGKGSVDILKNDMRLAGATDDLKGITFNSYAGLGHSTSQKELDDLTSWIQGFIPKTDD